MMQPHEHHLTVTRTARFQTLGTLTDQTQDVWFVLHGYGQLAAAFLNPFHSLTNDIRYVIAPEGLSRFYNKLDGPVGACWMTREDRKTDIADYVAYLDALYDHVLADVDRERLRIQVLGFSQGATTACRWVMLGKPNVDRLILWGGNTPHDLDLAAYRDVLNATNLTLVVGDQDHYITSERLAHEKQRLTDADVTYRLIPYAGKHRVEADILQQLA